ncbi:BA14K family protein [Bradyrhizobium sp. U87765 SZCCT0131]|uniref:BA14K family protein n=1 Tax=unclassified Bradyrhizobium TaxID=2631580 RepID=UPI001BA618B8|nr:MULTISPECIES: BA14K family protein [unclassified Bradyrhizobium]MBR1218593.1 BA14K family protein [Bradyrhizobium sp. U87765 SZCCT0131]MBR1265648.1 BA14K family protein [Bradyrhizobium sp. U87765 SZCCT0134]MBR1304091.1 BA14K family protein [Bradyrhizobium sp. U87765 SZCCT0110]MBR1319697.1 BA14K family protein [Bradyrhizobium sp. U87765 SZCCT0109]MBR1348022.1 BA14K family protein [Bradyrhizobium sp. U87765 SZCCT0048]
MRFVRPLAAALIATTALSAVSTAPALAAPLRANAGLAQAAPAVTESVQYRRWHGHGGYRGGYGYRHHHHGGGAGAGAIIGGLAAGAIIGGAIAAGQANAAAQRNAAYCAQRYRSYDPASGTYLNRDGNRYPCP